MADKYFFIKKKQKPKKPKQKKFRFFYTANVYFSSHQSILLSLATDVRTFEQVNIFIWKTTFSNRKNIVRCHPLNNDFFIIYK